MRIREVMTPGSTTIGADASIAEAMRTMLELRISGLPVLANDGFPIGIVTEGDLMRRAELGTERRRPRWLEFLLSPGYLAADYTSSHGRKVDEVMTHSVATIDADAELEEAVRIMEKRRVKRLPVLDAERLVGMLSRADLMRAYLAAMPGKEHVVADDAEVSARIQSEIRMQAWCPRENLHIEVNCGTAEISGVVTDERTREALCILVENVAGVRNVVDHLLTIEPVSGLIVRTPSDA